MRRTAVIVGLLVFRVVCRSDCPHEHWKEEAEDDQGVRSADDPIDAPMSDNTEQPRLQSGRVPRHAGTLRRHQIKDRRQKRDDHDLLLRSQKSHHHRHQSYACLLPSRLVIVGSMCPFFNVDGTFEQIFETKP